MKIEFEHYAKAWVGFYAQWNMTRNNGKRSSICIGSFGRCIDVLPQLYIDWCYGITIRVAFLFFYLEIKKIEDRW